MKRPTGKWICIAGVAGCVLIVGCRGAEKPVLLGQRPAPLPRQDIGTEEELHSPRYKLERLFLTPRLPVDRTDGQREVVSISDTAFPDQAEIISPVAWEEPSSQSPLTAAEHITDEHLSRPADSPLLSLEELQQLAITGNPTLRQAQANLQQAQGNWLQAGLYPNPVVGYNGTGNNGPFDAQGGFISQNIVTANKLGLNRDVASHDVQRAQWEAEAQRIRVINEIRIRYVTVLGAQRQVAVAEDLLRVADQGVKISEQLLQGEQVSKADVLQARLQRNQTTLILQNARFRESMAWKQLGNVIGWPNLPIRPLEGTLEEEFPEVDWSFAWQQLLNENPLLQAARSRAAAAVVQVHREEVQPIPDLQVMGNIWNDAIRPPSVMYGLNIGVALPIFDRNQGNITAAIGELHAAQSEVSRLELSLRDRLAETFQRYQSARNQVQAYRETILPTANENLSLTLNAYEEGEFDFVRVLTARRDLFQANIDYVTALTELNIAMIEIQGMQLTGGLEPIDSHPIPANQAGQTTGLRD